jgi:hypothetical protein
MAGKDPVAVLDPRFSGEGAAPTAWPEARRRLADAEVYWLSTVRPDRRPHVTPLIAVWLDDAMHFCTGPTERKAKNLETNPHCILTTGTNAMHEGMDVVVEGDAVRVRDEATLRRLAEAYEVQYGPDWHFDVCDGLFVNEAGGEAMVYRVAPTTAFGFGRGEPYSQTRWRFDR